MNPFLLQHLIAVIRKIIMMLIIMKMVRFLKVFIEIFAIIPPHCLLQVDMGQFSDEF